MARCIFWPTFSFFQWTCSHGAGILTWNLSILFSYQISLTSSFLWLISLLMGFPSSLDGKESAYGAGEPGLILVLGRSLGERNGYRLQNSCLENFMDRRAWQATVHGITELSMTEWLTLSFFTLILQRKTLWTKKQQTRKPILCLLISI